MGRLSPAYTRPGMEIHDTIGARIFPSHSDQRPHGVAFRGAAGLCEGRYNSVEWAKQGRRRAAPPRHSGVDRPKPRYTRSRPKRSSTPLREGCTRLPHRGAVSVWSAQGYTCGKTVSLHDFHHLCRQCWPVPSDNADGTASLSDAAAPTMVVRSYAMYIHRPHCQGATLATDHR